jgi:flagellar protein FlbD
MIRLTRFDGSKFVVNCDIIQYIEATPDTIISLVTRDKIMVRESVEQVIEEVVNFKRRIFRGDLEWKPEDSDRDRID